MDTEEKRNFKIGAELALLLLAGLVWFSVEKPFTQQPAQIIKSLPQAPEILAEAYLVKTLGSEKILLSRREWKHLSPASLTKILTAVVAVENIPAAGRVFFSTEAKKVEEKTSSAKPGESFLRDEMLKFALIGSANDSAMALAEEVGRINGGRNWEERMVIFRELLNKKAVSLGMNDSNFQNPVGLDEENHFVTAEDLGRLSAYIWEKYPFIWGISRNYETMVYSEENREYEVKNTNELLKEFPAILGSKTGFTDKAQQSLLMLYPIKNNEAAVIIILKSENREEDGRKIINWLEKISL